MENDPGVIVPRPTRGNGNREGRFERASDQCLMRRSDTILTASCVNDALFCTILTQDFLESKFQLVYPAIPKIYKFLFNCNGLYCCNAKEGTI